MCESIHKLGPGHLVDSSIISCQSNNQTLAALQVSALLGQMGGNGRTNVFGVIAEAAIRPERYLPDTPTKKVSLAA